LSATLYYFTGTGNSLWAARKLCERLGQAEVVSMVKALKNKDISPSTDTVGFVFPLYFCGIPDIARRFVDRVDLSKTDYVFAVVTRGLTSGVVFSLIDGLLARKQKKLASAFYLTMPDNYIPNIEPPSPPKTKKILDNASQSIGKIARVVRDKTNTSPRDSLFWKLVGKSTYMNWVRDVHTKDRFFNVNDDCNSCGICSKVCPVSNIIIADGKPLWQKQCEQCMACLQFCPRKAIQFSTKTLKRTRYHHPEVTVKDIISQKG